MDTTINLGLSKPDYENIGDIEVLNDNSDIIDGMFDGSHVVMSVNGVKPVKGNAQIDLGVTSVNGMTGDVTIVERSVKQLIDIIYPVGSYYDTSDKNFNPNTAWSGTTWKKITDGRTLIAGGNTYSIGSNYGATTHKLTIAELPAHNHSASSNTVNATGTFGTGGETPSLYRYDTSGVFTNVGTNGNRYSSGSTQNDRTSKIQFNYSHSHTISIGNTGSNIAFDLLQPSTAVARWHRTA